MIKKIALSVLFSMVTISSALAVKCEKLPTDYVNDNQAYYRFEAAYISPVIALRLAGYYATVSKSANGAFLCFSPTSFQLAPGRELIFGGAPITPLYKGRNP